MTRELASLAVRPKAAGRLVNISTGRFS